MVARVVLGGQSAVVERQSLASAATALVSRKASGAVVTQQLFVKRLAAALHSFATNSPAYETAALKGSQRIAEHVLKGFARHGELLKVLRSTLVRRSWSSTASFHIDAASYVAVLGISNAPTFWINSGGVPDVSPTNYIDLSRSVPRSPLGNESVFVTPSSNYLLLMRGVASGSNPLVHSPPFVETREGDRLPIAIAIVIELER